jgi:hypothetical protein
MLLLQNVLTFWSLIVQIRALTDDVLMLDRGDDVRTFDEDDFELPEGKIRYREWKRDPKTTGKSGSIFVWLLYRLM